MSQMSVTVDRLREDGIAVAAHGITLLGQAVTFGIYAAFFPFAVYITLRRRSKGFMNKTMLALMLLSFLIAAGYFIFNIASLAVQVNRKLINYIPFEDRPIESITKYGDLWNAIVFINVALTDGAVLWRAWVICGTLKKSKIVLIISMGALTSCFICVFLCIGLRCAIISRDIRLRLNIDNNVPVNGMLVEVLIRAQFGAVGFSLLTNILATGCIGARVWTMWRESSKLPPSSARIGINANDILLILIESGLVYCLSSTFLLAARFLKLALFSLATYYQPIHINFSALYPALLLVLVDRKRTLAWEGQVSKPSDLHISFRMRGGSTVLNSVPTGGMGSRGNS